MTVTRQEGRVGELKQEVTFGTDFGMYRKIWKPGDKPVTIIRGESCRIPARFSNL